MSSEAAQAWSAMLSGWAIPEHLVATAPTSPYFFAEDVFIAAADEALARGQDTPSDAVARDALSDGGTVLDVGCAAGAASLRLRPAHLVGVDTSEVLLNALTTRADALGIETTTVPAMWPDASPQVPVTDVVVCHHVFYNVIDLADFAAALTDHARRRVVVELTAVHPLAWMAPYWKALHGWQQPNRPVVADALNVLAELGVAVGERRWQRRYQFLGELGEHAVARIARRLCLSPSRHDELRRLLAAIPPPDKHDVLTLWWD